METKICKKCGLEKPLTEFNFKDKKCNKLLALCKECQRKRQRELYQQIYKYTNKENIKQSRIKYKEKILNFLKDFKKEGCCICKESDPCCLDFHHLYDKKFDLSHSRNFSLEKVKEELQKCIILCANCHRKLHAGKITLPCLEFVRFDGRVTNTLKYKADDN